MKIKVKVEADLGIGILSSPFSIFLNIPIMKLATTQPVSAWFQYSIT